MDELQIEILDSIGGWGFSFRDLYAKAKDFKGKKIRIPVNTYGGDAFQGLLIYNFLKGHNAEVEIHIPAYACSAGTMIAAAGDYVTIAENGYYMIHDPIGYTHGESEDMERTAKLLKDLTNDMINMYKEKTGLDEERIRTMMKEETWLTAKEALEMGFVDALTKGARIQANAEIKAFKNAPKELITPQTKKSIQMNELQIIAGFLGLSADAKMLDVQNAISSINQKTQELKAENATLKAEVKNFRAKESQLQAEQTKQLLDEAVKAGRITNEQRPFLEGMFEKDFENAKGYLASLQGKVTKVADVPQKGEGKTVATYQGKTFKELDRDDPQLLARLKENDYETFKALFKADYGVNWIEK